jgi:hypothetical protein
MAPYLDTLIGKLLALLQQGRRNVQQDALTSLASVADSAGDYFVKYYDTCMPLLRHVLGHAQDRAHALMRAKALECISLVGMAVGKERFAADAAGVMQYMQQAQAAGLDPDDPLASYMLQASEGTQPPSPRGLGFGWGLGLGFRGCCSLAGPAAARRAPRVRRRLLAHSTPPRPAAAAALSPETPPPHPPLPPPRPPLETPRRPAPASAPPWAPTSSPTCPS